VLDPSRVLPITGPTGSHQTIITLDFPLRRFVGIFVGIEFCARARYQHMTKGERAMLLNADRNEKAET
jgi:hypothetical protein